MVTGKYELEIKSPQGMLKAILDIVEADGQITGTQTDDSGTSEITAGKVNGNKISYKVKCDTPFGKTQMKGELEINGDDISGTTSFLLGKLPVKGHRIG